MTLLDRLRDAARATPARVVFPETDEPRIAQAMTRLADDGLCEPVPVHDTASDAALAALIAARGVKEPIARRMLAKPLFRAAAMVATGEASAMVAGVATPTRRVIEAAGLAIGLRDGVRIPSSFFLMRFPDGRQMIWADCGLNVDPTAEDLADIARASAASCAALIGPARVALLSFSTAGSGAGPSVDKVRTAAELSGFAGPLQADAALNPRIAANKGVTGGDANVLVFPDLDAGNIAYKLAQELAGAQALGPILQGFRRPVCDLSRGAEVEDIMDATVVTLALG
jgi:phosphate acetyltransferase